MADENGSYAVHHRAVRLLPPGQGAAGRPAACDYSEVNLAKDPVGRADLVALTGQMTFPQIVIGERAIGGFRELLEADRAGRLEDLLAA